MNKHNQKETILKNSFLNLISNLTVKLGGLLFTILLARFLLPEGYGIYSLIFSIAMIFFIFSDFGVNSALYRYLSYENRRNRKKAAAYFRYLYRIKVFLTIFSTFALLILAYPITYFIFGNEKLFLPLIVSAFYIFALSFENFYTQIYYSEERIEYINIKEILNQALKLFFSVGVFLIATASFQIIGVYGALAITSGLMVLFFSYHSRRIAPYLYRKETSKINKEQVNKFIYLLAAISIATILFSYLDSILLGLFLTPEFIGYYRSAFTLIWGITALLAFPNLIFMPLFTRMKKNEIGKILEKTIKYYFLLLIPSIFGLFVIGKYLLIMLYGYNYAPATIPFYFLVPMIAPAVLSGLFQTFFSAKEKPDIFLKIVVFVSILTICLMTLLISLLNLVSPLWASAGAAISISLAWSAYFVGCIYYLKKEFGAKIKFAKNIVAPLISSVIMALAVFFSIELIGKGNMNIFYGIGEICLGIIVYTLSIVILGGIKLEEIKLIYNSTIAKIIARIYSSKMKNNFFW